MGWGGTGGFHGGAQGSAAAAPAPPGDGTSAAEPPVGAWGTGCRRTNERLAEG